MILEQAIEIIEYYQSWRMGDKDELIYTPRQITTALELIIKTIKK